MIKANIKETLRIYWLHSKKYKLAGIMVIVMSLSGALLASVTPLYYKKFFDVFVSGLDRTEMVKSLLIILIVIGGLDLAGRLFFYLLNFFLVKFEIHCLFDLSATCFADIHRRSFNYFNNNFSGSLVKKINYFTRSYETIVDNVFFQILPSLATLVIIVAVLILKSQWLGMIALAWLAIFVVLNWVSIRHRLKYDLQRNKAESALTADLSDTIVNHNNVRLFNGWHREAKIFEGLNDRVKVLRAQSWHWHNSFDGLQNFLAALLNIALIYYGIKLWQAGLFTVGDFVLLQSYVMLIINRTTWLGNIVRRTYQALTDAAEMTEILNTAVEIADAPGAKALQVSKGEVSFRQAEFYFNETRPVLKKFDLSVAGGERIALIGPSGVGKTTITNLLLRNFDLAGGRILIDGQNIAKVTMRSLRATISLVPQDPILFHRSLADNIAYGQEKANHEDIIRAAKQANCHKFIVNLPDGYDTLVGERGVKLSGGERQRVAIARAILRGAPILILDEATSSLDSESEALIQDALEKLMKHKTVIVIAHRLSTIRTMDRIICINEHGIAETGAHDDLIKIPGGLYRRLWERQVAGFLK